MSAETGVPRGPRPLVGDVTLLAMIRDVIRETPFAGEGHRKVTARLRRVGLGNVGLIGDLY